MSSDRYLAYPSIFDSDICGSPVTELVLQKVERGGTDEDLEVVAVRDGDNGRELTVMSRELAGLRSDLDT